jgi:hypothetical protein
MLKKYVFITAFILFIVLVASSCIVVVPRNTTSDDNGSSSSKPKPKKEIIKGKLLVKATKSVVTVKDKSGIVYSLSGVSKSDRARFLKLNGKWVGVQIEVLARGKGKNRKARFIRFL